jgi:hypothetical protein
MRIAINPNSITFTREENDPKFYGITHAKGEHALFHFIKKIMNARGFSLIKKRMQKDGHMMGDEYQPYLRTKNPRVKGPHVMLYSGFYQIRGANEDWNEGSVTLLMQKDCFDAGQDTDEIIRKLS